MRKNVRTRSGVFSTWAIASAKISCGIVESTQMPSVFSTAFQKYESCRSRCSCRARRSAMCGSSRLRSVSETHAV